MGDVAHHRKNISRRTEGIAFLIIGSLAAFSLGLIFPTLV